MLVHLIWIFVAYAVLIAAGVVTVGRLRQLFAVKTGLPAWATFFSVDQYGRFLSHVDQLLGAGEYSARVRNGSISILAEGNARHIPLNRLAIACQDLPEREWNSALSQKIAELIAETSAVDVADFEQVKGALRVQLDATPPLLNESLQREDLPGLSTGLVLDLPGAVRSLSSAEVAAWNQPSEMLIQTALDHIRGMPAPSIEHIDLMEGLSAFVLTGESPFIASHALLLEDYPKFSGVGGAIVAVPTAHILLAYPITSRSAQNALFPMAWIATRRWQEGPGAISPRLFWYRGGRFINLPYDLKAEKFSVLPPTSFVNMLASLRSFGRS